MRRTRAGGRRVLPPRCGALACGLLLTLNAGCHGPRSSLVPAGEEAARILPLFWAMVVGGTLVWLLVIGLAVYATHLRPRAHRYGTVRTFLIGGGVVLPTVTLAVLLVFGLRLLEAPAPPADALRIDVTGERWWWRVVYENPDGGDPIVLANELRLPVNGAAVLALHSHEVIHSFWLPSLAGKRDLIPGRVNHLVLQPTRLGVYEGACAEYCGIGHANMAFAAEVMQPAAFAEWLARQAAPAAAPSSAEARRGATLFLQLGCGNCHAVRGTAARGSVGPDLTHVGSRHTIAAGRLPLTHATLRDWIAHSAAIKPGTLMPAYPLPPDELDALAAYLRELE